MKKEHPARTEITEIICTTWDLLESNTKTDVNSVNFLNRTKDMDDEEFFKYIHDILVTPKKHFYFEIELFKREPRFEEVVKADNYIHANLFDNIVFPHLSPNPDKPVMSIHKIFNGNLNIRKLQQMVGVIISNSVTHYTVMCNRNSVNLQM